MSAARKATSVRAAAWAGQASRLALTGPVTKACWRRIRVNAINLGLVITEGTHAGGIVNSDAGKVFVSMTLGRAAYPDGIAAPAAFLASDEARYITGETRFVSGGGGV